MLILLIKFDPLTPAYLVVLITSGCSSSQGTKKWTFNKIVIYNILKSLLKCVFFIQLRRFSEAPIEKFFSLLE